MKTELEQNNEYIVFHSNNTPTVDIAGTAVVKALKNNFPDKKIIVVSNFPEIYLHNPNIYRAYKMGQTPYFYEEFIKNKNTKVFGHDPLKESDYVGKNSHIIESWCKMCGIKWKGPESDELPKLYFTAREEEVSMRLTQSNKPLFFIQPYEMFGAVSPAGWSWPKDIPIHVANQIVHKIAMNGYTPVLIKNGNQKPLAEVLNLQLNLRQTLAALKFSEKRLFVDSFLAAASAAMDLPSVVTWLGTNPKQNGYKIHNNLIMKAKTELKEEIDKYHPTLDLDGVHLMKQVDVSNVYDSDAIVKEILEI
jgi:hypothetical protein